MVIATMFSIASVNAQSGKNFRRLHVNLGPEIGFPSGDFDKTHNMGVGGSAQLAIPFALRFFIIGHVGWVSHFGSGNIPQANLIPYRGGVRMRVIGSSYIGVQAGATTLASDGDAETAFSYSGGIGIANRNVDIGVRWDRATFDTRVDVFAVRFAYVFGMRLGQQQ
jgi:hypothetical protein